MSEGLASAVPHPAAGVRHRAAPPVAAVAAAALPAAAWLGVLVAMFTTRPLLPVDETRYAAVAWEMWRSGIFLVPRLDGHPYSDKPPLLFWLVTGGWSVLGPVTYWARLVGPICAAASLLLTATLARRLWPERPSLAVAAPLVLAGTLAWSAYSTLLLFDALLTLCVLVGLVGLVEARRGRSRGFVLFGLGLGLGLLAKGPVALIHLVPAAVTVPWRDAARAGSGVGAGSATTAGSPGTPGAMRTARWSITLGAAGLAGVLIALAWAVPAAVAGGAPYAREIFLGQTTGRVVHSFAHRRPFWWYGPQLLWMTLPWWWWPALWRSVRAGRASHRPGASLGADTGVRFCAVWALGALVAFSIVSGKQVHYLLPELPALALVVARVVLAGEPLGRPRANSPLLMHVSLIATGALLLVIAAHAVAAPMLAARYDLQDVATHLAAVERSGAPIAHQGRYAGQFTFLGRLERPVAEVAADSIPNWLATHRRGRAVTYADTPPEAGSRGVELVRRYRWQYIVVRRGAP